MPKAASKPVDVVKAPEVLPVEPTKPVQEKATQLKPEVTKVYAGPIKKPKSQHKSKHKGSDSESSSSESESSSSSSDNEPRKSHKRHGKRKHRYHHDKVSFREPESEEEEEEEEDDNKDVDNDPMPLKEAARGKKNSFTARQGEATLLTILEKLHSRRTASRLAGKPLPNTITKYVPNQEGQEFVAKIVANAMRYVAHFGYWKNIRRNSLNPMVKAPAQSKWNMEFPFEDCAKVDPNFIPTMNIIDDLLGEEAFVVKKDDRRSKKAKTASFIDETC